MLWNTLPAALTQVSTSPAPGSSPGLDALALWPRRGPHGARVSCVPALVTLDWQVAVGWLSFPQGCELPKGGRICLAHACISGTSE